MNTALLIALAITTSMTSEEMFAMGRELAETHCAACHAIASNDASPHPDAFALREVSRRYPVAFLDEAFVEGIVVNHPDMPVFAFSAPEAEALLTYLEAIQVP